MSKKLLEVGDIVYTTERWSSILRKHTIERVTAKQAFFGHNKCNRELRNGYGDYLCASIIGSYGSVTLQNESLVSQYNLQQARSVVIGLLDKVSKIRVDNKEYDDLLKLKSKLNHILFVETQPNKDQEVKECDATQDDSSKTA